MLTFSCTREQRADTYRLTLDMLEAIEDETTEAAAAAFVSAFIVLVRDADLYPVEIFTKIYDLIAAELMVPNPCDKIEIDELV